MSSMMDLPHKRMASLPAREGVLMRKIVASKAHGSRPRRGGCELCDEAADEPACVHGRAICRRAPVEHDKATAVAASGVTSSLRWTAARFDGAPSERRKGRRRGNRDGGRPLLGTPALELPPRRGGGPRCRCFFAHKTSATFC